MTGVTETMVWFLITSFLVFGMIVLGIYESVHSYDKPVRGPVHAPRHWWRRS